MLGKYYLDIEKGNEAIDHLSQAIANFPEAPDLSLRIARLYYLRSQAYRRQAQYEAAFQDVQKAISLAQDSGDDSAIKFYRSELEIVKQHAGNKLDKHPFADL